MSNIDHQQQRGAAWDIIDQAIASYDIWMQDDDYNATVALREIMETMKVRRALYADQVQPHCGINRLGGPKYLCKFPECQAAGCVGLRP